jgi:hypothetical protein
MNQDVRVEMTGPGRGRVFVDGEELKGVVGVAFSARVGEMNRLTIDLLTMNMEISGQMMVDVSNIGLIAKEIA